MMCLEDPSVNKLEAEAAALVGMEAALFVPTGTMGNLIAILLHCGKRGAELIAGDKSHIFCYEQGGAAQFGGVHTQTVPTNTDGTLDISDIRSAVKDDIVDMTSTELVCIENTHNMCGGTTLPIPYLQQVGELCKDLAIPLHMDGARLFDAAVHLKLPVSDIIAASQCSSCMICLSKGLGTPIGSLLFGSKNFIKKGVRVRKALGGGMHQAGVAAAAGLFALHNNIQNLHIYHQRVQTIARCISSCDHPAVRVFPERLHTNILIFYVDPDVITPVQFTERLQKVTAEEETSLCESISVEMFDVSATAVRGILHLNQSQDVDAAVRKLTYVLSNMR